MKPQALLYITATLCCLIVTLPAAAWHQKGHQAIALAAAEALPDVCPVFLRENAKIIAHCSVDADLARARPMKQLGLATGLEHYFDIERVNLENLPDNRLGFLAQLAKRDIPPRDVGLGLYAAIEARQKLAIALAEYRKWPENKAIQMKCLVYAGQLAHFTADLSQPLHTTVHHDGRLGPDGRSPRSGIHEKVDGLFENLSPDQFRPVTPIKPVILQAGIEPVLTFILQSHKLVDTVYELEPKLPARQKPRPEAAQKSDTPSRTDHSAAPAMNEQVLQFTRDRFNAAATFTASMIYTAWEESATVELPAWLEREPE